MTNWTNEQGGGSGGSGSVRTDVLNLIRVLKLEPLLTPTANVLTILKNASHMWGTTTTAPTTAPTTATTATTTVATSSPSFSSVLTTPTPFLYTLKSMYGDRYDQLMSPIQAWFYETTMAKKQQVQDGTLDVKEADQIDQECPCLCLLCGAYIRAGEKKNGIGACHRHVGMTPQGHRLDSEDICPVAKGGVGMFLLVERTSVSGGGEREC